MRKLCCCSCKTESKLNSKQTRLRSFWKLQECAARTLEHSASLRNCPSIISLVLRHNLLHVAVLVCLSWILKIPFAFQQLDIDCITISCRDILIYSFISDEVSPKRDFSYFNNCCVYPAGNEKMIRAEQPRFGPAIGRFFLIWDKLASKFIFWYFIKYPCCVTASIVKYCTMTIDTLRLIPA